MLLASLLNIHSAIGWQFEFLAGSLPVAILAPLSGVNPLPLILRVPEPKHEPREREGIVTVGNEHLCIINLCAPHASAWLITR